ncbi:hypothetical protein D3P07_24565 [Paenibacillus sp. 1011MAR3C5]|nr:hypothetical protein D3P07_24565 [Paenibacillus sp. 1011MAR3C5]
MACRSDLRQVFCAFGDFGIDEAFHPKVPWRRSSPYWESVRTFSSKQLGDAGPALAVGSDADRDAALRSLLIRCGMDIAKHKMACRSDLRQVFCAFGDFGIGEALHPKVPGDVPLPAGRVSEPLHRSNSTMWARP